MSQLLRRNQPQRGRLRPRGDARVDVLLRLVGVFGAIGVVDGVMERRIDGSEGDIAPDTRSGDMPFMPGLRAAKPGAVGTAHGADVECVIDPHHPDRDWFTQGAVSAMGT